MTRPFLVAQWKNLILANYLVPAELLEQELAPGLELDLLEGKPCASLVGFEFIRMAPQFPMVRQLIPRLSLGNFVELNLRFYVRQNGMRGVKFVREFVPGRIVASVARAVYNEPYLTAPLVGEIRDDPSKLTASYTLQYGGRAHWISATGRKPSFRPPEGSIEHFFKEHRWGFGTTRAGRLLRYEVAHPEWDVYPVESHQIDLDWAKVYGSQWACMQDAAPHSVILAGGSAITVYSADKSDAASVPHAVNEL
jgi:uncharacterized protein YqjF (DUF2071 family)